MTRKRRRLYVLLACGLGLGSASALALSAFSGNLVFFISPSQIADKAPPPGRSFRLGGLVEAGSVRRVMVNGHPEAVFGVTDGHATVRVDYAGILPDLFREGQGIVTMTHRALNQDGVLVGQTGRSTLVWCEGSRP